jgi:hypothetical protein
MTKARKHYPVRLSNAQLKRVSSRGVDGFRIKMGYMYHYFVLYISGAIEVFRYKSGPGSEREFIPVDAFLGNECKGTFFNVVVPYMKKWGWSHGR